MRPRSSVLTDHELELMRIIWERGEATVRDVYQDLLRRRRIAYTTVMTTLKTLEQKGYLKSSQQDRAFLYRSTQPKAKVMKDLVRNFIDRVFEGSAQPLLVHLLSERHISESDIAHIGRLLKEGNSKQARKGEKS
jgi:BlaI family transcriptional regulator, penicillinase repressor